MAEEDKNHLSIKSTPIRQTNSDVDNALLQSLSKVTIQDEFYCGEVENSAFALNAEYDDNGFIFRKRPPPSPAFSPMPSLSSEAETPIVSSNGVQASKRHSHGNSPALRRMIKFVCETPVDQQSQPQPAIAEKSTDTLLVYPSVCLDHDTGEHQENKRRLLELCGSEGILRQQRFSSVVWADPIEFPMVSDSDILRVHDAGYLMHLKRVCCDSPKDEVSHRDRLDFDTPLSEYSFRAARAAAGAVCYAVDKVMDGSARNSFVAVRPPGHHAGPRGSVPSSGFHSRPDMCSCGFCLLNNVAIAAAYALYNYGSIRSISEPRLEKVAIIDIDIHHGNGTEEIIRNLIPHEECYPLPASWCPMKYSSYRPWCDSGDASRVFFGSVHLYDEDHFYPGSGAGPHGDSNELCDKQNIVNIPLDLLGPKCIDLRSKLSIKARKAFMKEASKIFRRELREKLIPALSTFDPDLIFISAGFDGHADDFYYFLTEDDFAWITVELQQIADRCCKGRLVSVLEGGYNIDSSDRKMKKSKEKQFGSLARSCAAHVEAMMK